MSDQSNNRTPPGDTASAVLVARLEQLQEVSSESRFDGTPLMQGRRVGLEKESLRVGKDGIIAQTDHPGALGSALANPYITTDYSEALLELVTPAMTSAGQALGFLTNTQKYVAERLPDGEYLWNTSMPCALEGEERIRIGEYGKSNIGTMKTVYRRGLGVRYGKVMQTIAGIHYNFSWPPQLWQALASLSVSGNPGSEAVSAPEIAQSYLRDKSDADRSHPFVSEMYFAATRNLLRNGWLVPLLFGASPAICRTFLQGGKALPGMEVHEGHTLYEPYATSLRMGDIGYNYKRDTATAVKVDYSSLKSYTDDLHRLVTTPHPQYQSAGLRDASGQYQQLNTNILQIENEYYSSIRPKQLTESMEPPVFAMRERGIRYLELRSLDVNVFEPVGMSLEQLHFLEVFMLHALLQDSPPVSDSEMEKLAANRKSVAHQGRDPELRLWTADGDVPLKDCAYGLFEELQLVAQFLDKDTSRSGQASVSRVYEEAVTQQRNKIDDFSLTPSATVLEKMFAANQSYFDLIRQHSLRAQTACKDFEADPDITRQLEQSVTESLQKQAAIEAADELSFDEFLDEYQAKLEPSVPA